MAKWSIGRKVAVGFCAVLVQALGVGLFSLWIMRGASGKLNVVTAEYLPESELAGNIERELLNARIHFIYFVTIQKERSLEKGWERFRNAQQELPKLRELVSRSAALAAIRPEVDELNQDFNSYKPALEHIISMVQQKQNQGPEFALVLKEWARLGGAMVDSAGRLSRRGSAATADTAKDSSAQLKKAMVTAGISVIGLVLSVPLALFVTAGIRRVMRTVIAELAEAIEHVAHAATQITSSSQALANGASEQAAALEQTSASSQEVSSVACKSAENSQAAAGMMSQAQAKAGETNHALEQMIVAMGEIHDSSDKVSKIIKVINEIAFQTNILALNAAVEAARAGEAGLGFAVVAEEVRNLAQRCAQAASDTANLIEESIARTKGGKAKLDQVAQAVHAITLSASQVKGLVDDVNTGSQEQTRGIGQVAKAIAEMGQVTQRNAASAEESASTAEELTAQSVLLKQAVEQITAMTGVH